MINGQYLYDGSKPIKAIRPNKLYNFYTRRFELFNILFIFSDVREMIRIGSAGSCSEFGNFEGKSLKH